MEEIKYITIQQLAESNRHPFTMGQIRSWLNERSSNGLALCIRKIGKRLYIREDLFYKWVNDHIEC